MRGFGGLLRLQNGKEFMQKYHPMGSLAPRDVVARSIDHELKISGEEFVYLDITHKDPKEVMSHFPNIYKKCLSIGIDLTKDMIPVVPAAHYCCGGIKVNLNGESSIRRLYGAGRSLVDRTARRQPARVELDDGGGRLRRRGGPSRHFGHRLDRASARYPGMGLRRVRPYPRRWP